MKLYLDPSYRNECTVWFSNGNIQTLKGDIDEIVYRLKNFVMEDRYDYFGTKIGKYQAVDVYLDTVGVGMNYAIALSSMGVKFKKCIYEKLIK